MSKPQKVKLINSPIIAHLKALGVDVDMSAKGQAEWEDTPFNRLKLWFRYTTEGRTEFFDENINSHLQPLSASISETDPNIGRCTFSLKVPRSLCNAAGNLHGGAVATIFDTTTSMSIAPVARQGFWESGHVTRTLNCTYLRPAPEGTELLIECEVVHLGKRMGMVKGTMRRKDNGALCYSCEHQKAVAEFKPKYNL